MNHLTTAPVSITPESAEWPQFAPAWAMCAEREADGSALTFACEWSIPSLYRDGAPLLVIRIEQEFTALRAAGLFTAEALRVTSGTPTLWADWRREEIASTLRSIADALAPVPVDSGAALDSGENSR